MSLGGVACREAAGGGTMLTGGVGQGPVQESCPSDPSALQFRISRYAPPADMWWEQSGPSPGPLRREGVAEYEDGGPRGGGADPAAG